MSLDRLEDIRTFMVVADARSFSAAARTLQLSTNAVSLRVRQLERSMRSILFVRTTRNVSLTDEGRRFYERASRLLVDLEALEDEFSTGSTGMRGTVRVGLPAVLAGAPFVKHLRKVLDEHPELAVHTRVTNSMVMPSIEGLDIVVAVGPPADSSLVAKWIGRASWVLAAAPSYAQRHGLPRIPVDLTHHRCLRLLGNPPQDEWTLVESKSRNASREVTVAVGGNYQADDSRVLGDALYEGLGIGLRSLGECTRGIRDKTLVRVLPDYRFKPMDTHALMPRDRARLKRVAVCLEALTAAMAELQ